MLKTGLLNPAINSLLSHVRHANTLVIADRRFPFWPQSEAVDISLVGNVSRVLDVVAAVLPNFQIGKAWMAEELRQENDLQTMQAFADAHFASRGRVPAARAIQAASPARDRTHSHGGHHAIRQRYSGVGLSESAAIGFRSN